MTTVTENTAGQPETEYRRHLRALEDLAQQLERKDLDPEEALDVHRRAMEHHAELERILSRVEEAVGELETSGSHSSDEKSPGARPRPGDSQP